MADTEVHQKVTGEGNIFTGTGDIYNITTPPVSPVEADELRLLSQLADLVRNFWVAEVLEHSVHKAAMIQLRTERLSDAINHPWGRIIELPDQRSTPLDEAKQIGELFLETGRALLILGEPGAGKTTTLLELARDLLARFRRDPRQPVPVVLNLSTLHQNRHSFQKWVEAELKSKYSVRGRRAREWLETSRLYLLLDGLDEVSISGRAACVSAINEFCETGVPGIAVCSRAAEYTALSERLQFRAAIRILPLTVEQVADYLRAGGEQLAGVRQAIQEDHLLGDLARSPLMLSVISVAYQDSPTAQISSKGAKDAEGRRAQLFDSYVRRMFKRIGKAANGYTQEKTIYWLSWLGRHLRKHSTTVFLLEELQPSWLQSDTERWLYCLLSRLATALVWVGLWCILNLAFGLLSFDFFRDGIGLWVSAAIALGAVPGLIDCFRVRSTSSILSSSIPKPVWLRVVLWWMAIYVYGFAIAGLGVGMVIIAYGSRAERLSERFWGQHDLSTSFVISLVTCAILFMLRGARCSDTHDTRLSGTLNVSWIAALKWAKSGARVGAIVSGILIGVWILENGTAGQDLLGLLMFLPYSALTVIVFALSAGVYGLFTSNDLSVKVRPGQALAASSLKALMAGITFGLLFGIPVAFASVKFAQQFGIWLVMTAAFCCGGVDVIHHLMLRTLLRVRGFVPNSPVAFLDYAARLIFLQRVGSGYIFIHRSFLDYFADFGEAERREREEQERLEHEPQPPPPDPVTSSTSPGKRKLLLTLAVGRNTIAWRVGVAGVLLAAAAIIYISSYPSKPTTPYVSKPPSVTPAAALVVVTPSPTAVATPSVEEKARSLGSDHLSTLPVDWIKQVERYMNAKDYAKALPLSQKAADAGNTYAMGNLGWLYKNVQDLQDYAKAREWLQKAAAAGDTYSMSSLGELYMNGWGIAQDYGKARELYRKAADAGNAYAMNSLGLLYKNGQGVVQDYAKAREWYQKAADAGNTDAVNNLGLLYDNGWGVAQDYGKAREWYQKAADAGETYAMSNLGALYNNGQGVAQDYNKAREWYQKAADAGNADAKQALSRLPK